MNPPAQNSGTAIASLIFGIVSWFALPIIGAIVAIICGHVARSEIRRMPPGMIQGDGLALAGLILGYSQLIIGGLLVMAMVMAGIVFFGLL